METKHWGDMPIVPDTESGIAALEREHMIKPRPMEVEGPRLHQPSSRHYPPSVEPLPPERFAVDPLTLHTIQLVQHAKRLRQLIYMAQQQYECVKNGEGVEMLNFPPVPPIPEYNRSLPKHNIARPVPFEARDLESDFSKGKGTPPPEIDDITNRRLLRRSVSAVCAHAGYDTCPESILETLTDVTQEYFLNLTKALRHAVDREAATGKTGFQDVMDQAFHEMGIGSVRLLHDFYQNRIINYRKHMIQQCNTLMMEYDRVKNPEYRNTEDFKVIKVKEEPISDIHFPVSNDEDDNEAEPLDLQGLSSLDNIQVEHESSGLNQEEVIHIKNEPIEKSSMLDSFDESPGDHSPVAHIDPEEEGLIQAPGSIPVTDIMSPPQPKKKRKR
ncbi:STAGA complex 65 subunit gamma-like [Lineus longissimus]|uniref:STAGA complex 65 subunit gamma-like n=1 Tax=Lineus longissimus TaxID=88925 RepID=UPI002B4C79EB